MPVPASSSTEPTLLLIDDDEAMRLCCAGIFRGAGYGFEEACDGEEGLAQAERIKPALILLDVDMPGKDGGEVAREMKADPYLCEKPVLFFTSLISTEEAGKREVMRGGQPFLAKPVNPTALVEAVSRLLHPETALTA